MKKMMKSNFKPFIAIGIKKKIFIFLTKGVKPAAPVPAKGCILFPHLDALFGNYPVNLRQ